MKEKFTLTEDHITLLNHSYVSWDDCEFGAAAIDCKRPYGDSSVVYDICTLLGWATSEDFERADEEGRYDEFYEEFWDRANKIHREIETALQVCLDNLSFQTGEYEREKYTGHWEPVE